MKAVSEILYSNIQHLMSLPKLKAFNLGGGTNLAIRYNHRVSTDIDLFSQGIVGKEAMGQIKAELESNIEGIKVELNNASHPSLSFINAKIPFKDPNSGGLEYIKVEIIQNLKNLSGPEIMDGIRLIHIDDIGFLKLLSAAGRGTRKDFYDLYLLTEINPFAHYYALLLEYQKRNIGTVPNLFENLSPLDNNGLTDLSTDLSILADFNRASDEKKTNNRIIPVTECEIANMEIGWQRIKGTWKRRVENFAKEQGLKFSEIGVKRPNKNSNQSWFIK